MLWYFIDFKMIYKTGICITKMSIIQLDKGGKSKNIEKKRKILLFADMTMYLGNFRQSIKCYQK